MCALAPAPDGPHRADLASARRRTPDPRRTPIKAERNGGTVTLTMTVKEAADLENELLWSSKDDDKALLAAYDALTEISEGEQT